MYTLFRSRARLTSARRTCRGVFLRPEDAHVAETGGVDGPRVYSRALVRLRRGFIEVRVKVRHPSEQASDEATFEFGAQPLGVVEPLLGPPGEVRPCVILVVVASTLASARPSPAAPLELGGLPRRWGGREAPQGPLCRGLVDPLPRELDHD